MSKLKYNSWPSNLKWPTLRPSNWPNKWLVMFWWPIKTFIHIHLHARETAIVLDDCMLALGQMNHPGKGSKETDVMMMPIDVRSSLIRRALWSALPNGWKWRN